VAPTDLQSFVHYLPGVSFWPPSYYGEGAQGGGIKNLAKYGILRSDSGIPEEWAEGGGGSDFLENI